MTTMVKGDSRTVSAGSNLPSWFNANKALSVLAFLAPVLVLAFLGLFRALNLETPVQLLGLTLDSVLLGVGLTAGSAVGLAFTIKAPSLLHRSEMPGILRLIAPFLKTSMWESQELAGVMHRSWQLMTKHVAFVQTLAWTQNYSSKPSNFTMSEAISLILKLLPPVEKHSATCLHCN
ncbi:MAG: hypothetical protein AUG17_04170 [Crenarchaeota archaeon 13_1_20CM_2_53_14]|nr:MAG: hypothetical protein AUG17_04170 [Crenarchaeota archaeon 13_1_20CM_2_53_14]TMI26119.1 MAG: hypothetical protein E6H24_03665 [Candidatus Bathyarchaeota archaeon]